MTTNGTSAKREVPKLYKRAVVRAHGWGETRGRDRWGWVAADVVAGDVTSIKFPLELERQYLVCYCDTGLLPREAILAMIESAPPWEDNLDQPKEQRRGQP